MDEGNGTPDGGERTAMEGFPDLVTPWYEYKAKQYTQSPCTSNRASSIGGDCERELVYWRTRWQEAQAPDVGLQIILQEGSKHEREVLFELSRAGVEILEQQTALEWRELQITGHVDAVVVNQGAAVPLDVKSMAPQIWGGIFRRGAGVYPWEEVETSFRKKPWLRKYLAQVTLYCLMRNAERGLLLCLNKATGALAQVSIQVDWDYGEFLLRRAERINEHVRVDTLPERIPFDDEVCPRCAFYPLCLPDHQGKPPIAFLEDAAVEALLADRERTEEARALFERTDKKFKDWAKAQEDDRISIGRWLVRKKPHGKGTRVLVDSIDDEPSEGEA